MRAAALVGAVILVGMTASPAAAEGYDREAALAMSQGALGATLREHTFRDTAGQSFTLESLRGKPLVVSLIYTSCHHVCPMITANIERNVDIAHEALGEDAFSVVTIGFDWQVDHNWRYHPRLGWTQVPDARYEVTMNGLDLVVAFNAEGFRDDAHALEPDPGVKREIGRAHV